jgi:hypothetical protein
MTLNMPLESATTSSTESAEETCVAAIAAVGFGVTLFDLWLRQK